jgi:hypothetical protein
MADKCNVEVRNDKPMCTIHRDQELTETGATEIDIGAGPSPHPYKPTSYFCPVSGQQFAHMKGVPPQR